MSSTSVSTGPRVLVAPLDWGLGHATRCIPIIRALQARGIDVLLGGSGASGRLLREAFPDLLYEEIPARTVRYSRTRRGWLWKILQQLPRLRRNAHAEKQWLNNYRQRQKIHAVLSDNRYGLYAADIPSIFLCHQLSIRSGLGRLADQLLRRQHYRMIGKFSACWVPDWQEPALAGTLSQPPVPPPIPTRYIGPLSRFHAPLVPAKKDNPLREEKENTISPTTSANSVNSKPQTPNWYLVVALSGPEPQRTLWEENLLPQLALLDGPVLLLRGLPGDTTTLAAPPNVHVAAHLAAAEMADAFSSTRYVVARCGYSTVMDLVALRCKGILVPTPGQTEQEYLAHHLTQQRIALCYRAEDFDLQRALHAAEEFNYRFPERKTADGLNDALNELLEKITEPS